MALDEQQATMPVSDLAPLRDLSEPLCVVYVYGVPARLDGATVARVTEVGEQLWLAHRLRGELVAIEHTWEDRKAEIWSSIPEIAGIEASLASLEEEIDTLIRRAGKERSQRRRRGVTASAEALTGLRARRKELRAQRRELIGRLRAEHAAELAANNDARAAAIKATYARYCQEGVPDRETGEPKKLFWATYNDVTKKHKTAASRVQAVRAQGRPARLRHHRWDGSGAISVQLQRESGAPPRTPATIAGAPVGLRAELRRQFLLHLAANGGSAEVAEEAARVRGWASEGLPAGIGAGDAEWLLDRYEDAEGRWLVWVVAVAGLPASLRCRVVGVARRVWRERRSLASVLRAAARTPWRNVLHLPGWVDPAEWAQLERWEQRRDRLHTARLSVGEGRMVELPVIVHRMLPADAEIVGAQLVTVRVGPDTRTRLHLTATLPPPAPAGREPVVALHLGWRRDPDRGEVTVATWRCTHPVRVPVELDARLTPGGPVVVDSDQVGRVVLGARWLGRVDAHDRIRGERDLALGKVRDELVAWLDRHPGGVQWRDQVLTGPVVAQWRSPGRFAVLAGAWREDPPEGGEEIAAALEAWRKADRRVWRGEAHGREGALAQRTDVYRRVVAWLVSVAGGLVVEDTDLAEVARRPDPEREPELPPVVEERAARQRALAAVGRLREVAVDTATREGVPVWQVPHTGNTRTHYRCGHVNPADGRYAVSRVVACDGCGGQYDQDRSATLMMLAAVGCAPPPGSGRKP